MGFSQRFIIITVAFLMFSDTLFSQAVDPVSGEITVQLIQGLNSATNPKGVSQGRVTKSTNPAVPVGSSAMMAVGSDPTDGGYVVKLLQLGINGQTIRAASSAVTLAPDLANKGLEMTRNKSALKDSASGAYVFLPEKMIVRFTLTTPPPTTAVVQRSQQPLAQARPKTWVTDMVAETADSGAEVKQRGVLLEGTVSYKNTTAKAYLVMHCDFPTKNYPSLLPLETILGVNPEMLSAPGLSGVPIDLSEMATSQLGNTSAIHTNASGQNRSNGGRIKYFYDVADMQAIVDGAGQTLRLSLGVDGPPETVAQFSLPADNSPVKQIMSACMQRASAEAQESLAQTVAACPPPKEGLVLGSVQVTYADTGKNVKGDMNEMDDGGVWTLDPPAKGRPVRKTLLTCSYRALDTAGGPSSADKAVVPIPSIARTCGFNVHKNEAHNEAVCFSASPVGATATSAPVAAAQAPAAGKGVVPQQAKNPIHPSESNLPVGPTGPVDRLNVRGISVRMGRGQILTAAKAAGMVVLGNSTQQLKIADPTASGTPVGGASKSGGSGLVLTINMKEDRAITVFINEQDDMNGHVFEDVQKKWGSPKGKDDVGPYWGDLNGIYADYDSNMYGFLGIHVTIEDKAAFPVPPKRQAVPM